MKAAGRERVLVTPFWVRLATETSLWPGWLLIAVPAVLYPTYLALEALFGRGVGAATDFVGDYEARILPFWVTALGYGAMMSTYVARGTFRDLEALRPVLRGGEAACADLRRQLTRCQLGARHRIPENQAGNQVGRFARLGGRGRLRLLVLAAPLGGLGHNPGGPRTTQFPCFAPYPMLG